MHRIKVNCPSTFQHKINSDFSKYFAIWGCHQINETFYDRGLWIFGGNENPDVERVVDVALSDMNLEGVDGLKEALVVRTAETGQKTQEHCSNDTYYQTCSNKMGKSGSLSEKSIDSFKETAEVEDVWIWNEEKCFIVVVVLLISLVLGLTTSIICVIGVEN